MNYIRSRAQALKMIKRGGALGVLSRTERDSSVTTVDAWGMRIERRIGDLKKFDESVEIGDYKFIVEGAVEVLEGDTWTYAGERRLVSRIEEFKPTDVRIFTYVWTRSA